MVIYIYSRLCRNNNNIRIRPYELHFDSVNFSVCDTINNNTRKFSIVHSGIIEWNTVTNDIKLYNNIIMFKLKLTAYNILRPDTYIIIIIIITIIINYFLYKYRTLFDIYNTKNNPFYINIKRNSTNKIIILLLLLLYYYYYIKYYIIIDQLYAVLL